MNFKKMLILIGVLILVGAVLAACGGNTTTEPTTAATEAPVAPIPDTPYLAEWQGSGHADVASEPFRHWDDATETPKVSPHPAPSAIPALVIRTSLVWMVPKPVKLTPQCPLPMPKAFSA